MLSLLVWKTRNVSGQNFTILVDASKSNLIVFGDNKYGQLGIDPEVSGPVIFEPRTVQLVHPVLGLACGWTHSVLLLANSTLFTMGRSDYGQLGR
jgi:alpha-tubulin suppressor-like RCC1 family protein